MRNGIEVNKTLFPKGDQAVLAKDLTLDDLAVGQLGVFDFDTTLSVDLTNVAGSTRMYMAVKQPDGTVRMTGAGGLHLETKGIQSYEGRCYTPCQAKVIEISDLKSQCESEYSIKFNITSGSNVDWQGGVPDRCSFTYMTGCCGSSCDCPGGSCTELALGIVKTINMQNDGAQALFTAYLVPSTAVFVSATPLADVIDYTDQAAIDAWITANPDGCFKVRVIATCEAANSFCQINYGYQYPRYLTIDAYPSTGLDCSGVITCVQELVMEEISAEFMHNKAYWEGGWSHEPGVNRVLSSGQPFAQGGHGFPTHVNPDGKYVMLDIGFITTSQSGMKKAHPPKRNTIAMECGQDKTIASVVELFDKIVEPCGLKPQAAYFASCPKCTVVNMTSDPNNAPDGEGFGGRTS